jgi:hypothetical protein
LSTCCISKAAYVCLSGESCSTTTCARNPAQDSTCP